MFNSDNKIVPAEHRFDIDIDQTSGLSLRVKGGVLLNGLGLKHVSNATLTLTASADNYVEMDDDGVVSTNTTGFTAGYTSLYVITTNATVITGVMDARGGLVKTTSQIYGITPFDLRSTAGAPLTAAETAGNFNVSVAANVAVAQGEICDNETEVSEGNFQFVLPPEYIPGGAITLRVKTKLVKTAAANDAGSSLDAECFVQDGNGAVGADICATAAQVYAAVDTWYTRSFTITPTSRVPGDILNFVLTTSVVDDEVGGGTLRAMLDGIAVLLDVQN